VTDFDTAETGIRQLHARYADAVWRRDHATFGDCFVEDAEWRIAGVILRGRDEIETGFDRFMVGLHRVLMTFRTPILTVESGTAMARTYVTEQTSFDDGRAGLNIGIYYERFVDQGGLWKFSWRLFQLHYSGPPDMTGAFFENPDHGPPPGMPDRDAATTRQKSIRPGK
jgi:ketosteroid isomerase-like protein